MSALRELLWAAFPPGDEGFTEEDWQHALGGSHFMLEQDGAIVAHASVVEREIHVDGRPLPLQTLIRVRAQMRAKLTQSAILATTLLTVAGCKSFQEPSGDA